MVLPAPLNTPPEGGTYYQLNRRQQVFVDQLALNGGDILEAWRHAGYYAASEDDARSAAWRLAARQDVRKAFLEVVRGRAIAHAPDVIEILKKIAGDAKATMNTRVKAAQALAEIIGLNAPPEAQQVNVEVRMDRKQYERLAITLLGNLAPEDLKVIDAEFMEIEGGTSKSDRPNPQSDEEQGLHPDANHDPAPASEAPGGHMQGAEGQEVPADPVGAQE